MDRTCFLLRPFRDDDVEAFARIGSLQFPETPRTADEIRHYRELLGLPPQIRYEVAVEERSSGRMVAEGELGSSPHSFDPKRLWAYVTVDPEFERLGIGRALGDHLVHEARRREVRFLMAGARLNHPRALRFLQRSGFVEKRRTWRSVLEVASAPLESIPNRTDDLAREGIELTTLAEEGADRPEVRDGVYRLSVEASRDVPRVGVYTPVSRASFVAAHLEGPGVLPDAFFLAKCGHEYLGLSNLEKLAALPATLIQAFTGTHPAWRRRGIALELKRRGVAYARRQGFKSIQTFNDSLNEPMWSINRRLGYQRQNEWLEGELSLVP